MHVADLPQQFDAWSKELFAWWHWVLIALTFLQPFCGLFLASAPDDAIPVQPENHYFLRLVVPFLEKRTEKSWAI